MTPKTVTDLKVLEKWRTAKKMVIYYAGWGRHDDKDGNGGNLCKIMFSRLHETEFLSQKDKNKTTFHSIIAERGLFVKGVFLCVKNLLHQALPMKTRS